MGNTLDCGLSDCVSPEQHTDETTDYSKPIEYDGAREAKAPAPIMQRSKSSVSIASSDAGTVALETRHEDEFADDYVDRNKEILEAKHCSWMKTSARMQHLLGITTLWALLPACIHMVQKRDEEFYLVGMHFSVTIASVLYWRHYDQKSLSGHLDRIGAILTMAGLTLRAGRRALLPVAFLIISIFFFYQMSVALRAKNQPGLGLVAHVTFRFSAFWLSVLVLIGKGSFPCAFCAHSFFLRFIKVYMTYAIHSAFEFFVGADYTSNIPSSSSIDALSPSKTKIFKPNTEPPVLPWLQYSFGLLRTALLVSFSGYNVFSSPTTSCSNFC